MHGGAGGIISIGMLRAVSLEYMEKCVKSLYSTGTHLLTSGIQLHLYTARLQQVVGIAVSSFTLYAWAHFHTSGQHACPVV